MRSGTSTKLQKAAIKNSLHGSETIDVNAGPMSYNLPYCKQKKPRQTYLSLHRFSTVYLPFRVT